MNYHLLHITYTTGVHANTFRVYHVHTNTLFIVAEVVSRLLTKGGRWDVEE